MYSTREFSHRFRIDGQKMPDPDSVEITENDLDSECSGRDEAGFLRRVVLREGVRTWSFTYAFLSYDEYLYLRRLFQGKPVFQFTHDFYDNGEEETVQAYCAKRSVVLRDPINKQYKNLKFNIVEC